MRLSTGEKAPEFTVIDYLNSPLSLRDYQGQKILLSFLRGAPCPFCNLRVRELIQQHDQLFDKGIQIFTFFAARPDEIKRYAGSQNAPFPILADPDLKIYQLYGVESSLAGMFRAMLKPRSMLKVMTSGFFNLTSIKEKPILPADFLLDETHVISSVHYGRDFGDHMDIGQLIGQNN